MAPNSRIEWTEATWNPLTGCTKVSPGCKNCYAETLSKRYSYPVWGPDASRRVFGESYWRNPLKWNREAERVGRRARVFCSSMCDIFEDHPTINEEREKLWPLIRETPWLDWQLLTKRADRIKANLPSDWGDGYPNVWLGVSIENNEYAVRADILRRIPAAVRFVSFEPALGPLDALDLDGIAWVIYGGESGPGYRQDDPAWARQMLTMCRAAGVGFFYKQSCGPRPETCIELDGRVIREWPTRPVLRTA